jgi:hypothetical protein
MYKVQNLIFMEKLLAEQVKSQYGGKTAYVLMPVSEYKLKSCSRLGLHKAPFFLYVCFRMLTIVYGKLKTAPRQEV